MAASPLPSPGSTRGRKCYVTPAFSGVPNKGDEYQEWLSHPCTPGGPQEKRYITLAFFGVPNKGDKTRSGCLTPALSGAHKRAAVLHNPLRSGGSPTNGTKSEVGASPLPSRGPTRERKCYVTLAFSGVPNKGDKIKRGRPTPAFSRVHKMAEVLRNPCVLGGPEPRVQESEVAASPLPWGPAKDVITMSPLRSEGSPQKRDKIRSGFLTPAFMVVHKRADVLCNPRVLGVPNIGDNIRSGCLTPAFSRVHTRAEMLRNPCVLGGPQQTGQHRKRMSYPCLLRGPQEGGSAT